MLNLKTLIFPVMATLTLGCASLGGVYAPDPETYALPAAGSEVRINQTLRAKNGARIYIQGGEVQHWRDVFRLEPYCVFHVFRTPDELTRPIVIDPDTFMVKRVFRRKDLVAAEGNRYASNLFDSHHGASERSMSTYLQLASARQPRVTRLVCARWADPYYQNHVGLRDIRRTLGDLVRLTP